MYEPKDIYNVDEIGLFFFNFCSVKHCHSKGGNATVIKIQNRGWQYFSVQIAQVDIKFSLLLLENTWTPKLKCIEIFSPANCISVLQLLDMVTLKWFKGYYGKRLVDSILLNIENKVEVPFKVVNVKEACDNIAGRW